VAHLAGSRDPTSHGVCRPPIVPQLGFATDCEHSSGQASSRSPSKRAHLGTEFPFTIKDNVSIRAWERQRLSKLLHNPLACRVCGRVEVEIRLRPCSIRKKQYSPRKLSVCTVKNRRRPSPRGDSGRSQPAPGLGVVGLAPESLQIARHSGFRNIESEL